ncbi:DUF192 domain-containing protein [Serratia sp. UGAL515B_01]|uniref:DUF192 domain-containing protein n=1 Tax=Serratia sp. UGAL515B_01 TaxID=2986763 RepID=UPI0029532B1E|nr:DUF192 domain-containing protein [Serratia sp. UGAL515B_01]WON78036.1 DUF192 domain-containing protein [Serratia sp. UGAL515B_01]
MNYRNGVISLIHAARNWRVSVVLMFTMVFSIGNQQAQATQLAEKCDLHFSNGTVLQGVPVVRTIEQQAKGLSNRSNVGPGMLFSWDKPEPRIFWMRNTYVPLTIGFFDNTGLLFAVEDMQPETDDHHFSNQPALDALELAHGEFQKHGLKEGVRLTSRTCVPQ